jgi:hypothetical protein
MTTVGSDGTSCEISSTYTPHGAAWIRMWIDVPFPEVLIENVVAHQDGTYSLVLAATSEGDPRGTFNRNLLVRCGYQQNVHTGQTLSIDSNGRKRLFYFGHDMFGFALDNSDQYGLYNREGELIAGGLLNRQSQEIAAIWACHGKVFTISAGEEMFQHGTGRHSRVILCKDGQPFILEFQAVVTSSDGRYIWFQGTDSSGKLTLMRASFPYSGSRY